MLVTLGAVVLGTGLWLFVLRRYDRVDPQRLRRLVAVALVGGGASLTVAALLNEAFGHLLGLPPDFPDRLGGIPLARLGGYALFVGFNEEACKALAAVAAARLLGRLDEPIDAMLVAMTVALGFAAVENAVYAQQYGREVLLVRFLWPVPAHMAYAAVWGYGLARARFGGRGSGFAVLAPSVVAAGLLHAGANFALLSGTNPAALASLAGLVGLAVLAHLRLRRLVAASPYLEPGECASCRNLNPVDARVCLYCGASLARPAL